MTSAVKESADNDVAVRHVPFTAIESPMDKPCTDSGAVMVKIAEVSPLSVAATVPSSVISPVNI
jgi:hypothetical protein